MIIDYIGADGNKKQTADVVAVPVWLEQIGKIWFEKKEVEKPVVKKEEKVITKNEEIVEEIEAQIDDDIEAKAKEFLKAKKIRGFGLLKGDNLIKRAVEEGFIINS
jgi:hypothetical protein